MYVTLSIPFSLSASSLYVLDYTCNLFLWNSMFKYFDAFNLFYISLPRVNGRTVEQPAVETDEFSVAAGALHLCLLLSEISLEKRREGSRRKELVDRGELIAKVNKFGVLDRNPYHWPVLV